ncbi:hypothetical protein ACP4OV_028000 [Aristida adscensionis]
MAPRLSSKRVSTPALLILLLLLLVQLSLPVAAFRGGRSRRARPRPRMAPSALDPAIEREKNEKQRISGMSDPCDRVFERLGTHLNSDITLEDARACLKSLKATACPAAGCKAEDQQKPTETDAAQPVQDDSTAGSD